MKILIASDIHGRYKRMERLCSIIQKENPEKIIMLGDFLYNGPRNGVPDDYDPMGVANLVKPLASRLIPIRGNCDADIDITVLGFPLPRFQNLTLNGYDVHLIHGDDFSLVEAKKGDIVMFGHIHVPLIFKKDGLIILNPGSVSFPKDGSVPSFAIFTDSSLGLYSLESGEAYKTMELPQGKR